MEKSLFEGGWCLKTTVDGPAKQGRPPPAPPEDEEGKCSGLAQKRMEIGSSFSELPTDLHAGLPGKENSKYPLLEGATSPLRIEALSNR